MQKDKHWLFNEAGRRNILLTSKQTETLFRFAEVVLETGIVWGLSGRKNLEEILEKDILDSLLLIPFVRDAYHVLDIGSGAGFPGIPLAIVFPSIRITLLESKLKAVKFLETLLLKFGIKNVLVEQNRAEALVNDPAWMKRFDAVTGRAVAPLARFIPWSAPFVKVGGKLIVQKGKKWEDELAEAQCEIERNKLYSDGVFPGLVGDQKIILLRRTRER